jgi:nitroreductase
LSDQEGFFTIARAQRAHRAFSEGEVPDEDLRRILEAATWAPSAENSQPWVFVVVRDAARRAELDDLARRLWDKGGRQASEGRLDPRLLAEVDHATRTGFAGAPVVVVVAGDTARCHRGALASSVFPAVQNLLLAAGALGYGTALTTLTTYAADDVRRIVELPEGVDPLAVVPIGRPPRPLGPSRREPVDGHVHVDRYGGGPLPG